MNKIEIGDIVFIKTVKQILYYLSKNIGHLRVIYSYKLLTITNTDDYDDIVRTIESLNGRKFVVTDTYKLNDINFIRLQIDNDKSISISTELVAKKLGVNIDVKTFYKLFNTLNRKFKVICFYDGNSMLNRRIINGIVINDFDGKKFNNSLMFDISSMKSFIDIISLNRQEIMTLINGGDLVKHNINITIKYYE